MVDARTEYMARSMLTGVPVLGDFLKAQDRMAYMDDYLRNRGLNYNDIRYPTLTMGGSMGGMVSYVSSNIRRLYR